MRPVHIRRIRGQGMSEYIIITALIAVAAIGIFAAFGDVIQSQTAGMARELSGQSADGQIQSAQDSADTAVDRSSESTGLDNYDARNGDNGD